MQRRSLRSCGNLCRRLKEKLSEETILQNMKYQEVITWSTDGLFRETKENVVLLSQKVRLSVVEMECSALNGPD